MSIAHKSNRLGVNPGQPWIEFDNNGRVIDMDIRKSRRLNVQDYRLPFVFDYECPELEYLEMWSACGANEITCDFPKLTYLCINYPVCYSPRKLLGHFPKLVQLSLHGNTLEEVRYGFPALQIADNAFERVCMSVETANFIMSTLPVYDHRLGGGTIGFRYAHPLVGNEDLGTLIDPTIATKKGWTVQLTSGDVKP